MLDYFFCRIDEMLNTILSTIQTILAILLTLAILIQSRASGLSSTFGGMGAVAVQRRGAEKVIFQLTIYVAIAFFALAVLRWYI